MATQALHQDDRRDGHTGLRRDERIGLVLAVALHGAVLAALLLSRRDAAPVPEPERVSVTISDDAAPTSTAPQPAAQPQAEEAPELGDPAPPAPAEAQPEPAQPEPAPPAPTEAQPEPAPPVPAPAPPVRQPQPRPQPITRVQPQPQPQPRPAKRVTPTPPAPPAPAARPRRTPSAIAAPARPATTAARSSAAAATPPKRAGGSRIGTDFLKGVANAPATPARGQPAASVGPAERASLSSAIARQLKPDWTAPQGADAELLVTVLTWDLDANGRLKGKPRVVSQQGITDSNRAQAARHAEQAVRAVELAAPFDLPAQYYAAWRHVAAFRFDRRLSQ